ncbi:MAG: signal peptidase I [Dehalococcoidales bacterium]
MKRPLTLAAIIAACLAGFLSIRGVMPFMSIYGTSMEPELQAGNLILIEEVPPSDVEVGDIIVFTIPAAVREHYNYPTIIAHRVIEVRTSERGVTFRTKGDNTGEDPFSVRPQDLRGTVSRQIPYLGFPLLFFQSRQGLIFIIVALGLLAFYLYANELSRGRQKIQEGIFAPVIHESRRSSRAMAQTVRATEKRMESTEQTLAKFASAIEVYAQHLQSHTSAIQGLSEASQELKKGAAEQNKVLIHLVEAMELGRPKIEEVKPEVEEIKFPPGCVKSRSKPTKEEEIFKAG